MSNDWISHADWWLDEVAADAIYRLDVLPLAADLIGDQDGVVVDLGCGEGQMMRHLDGPVIGCDISPRLLCEAANAGTVVRCRLPDLSWLGTNMVDCAYTVLVVEHLADLDLFSAAARVVKNGGPLVTVMNHPAFTPEGAGPIMDPADGEFLWRWGDYFTEARVEMSAGQESVAFYHRPLAAILNAAAEAGWLLSRIVERGFSGDAIAAEPGYAGQEQMPRLLGVRWINTQGGGLPGR